MEDCCESFANGFPCTCGKNKDGEDDGYADYLYDQMRDEQIEKQWREEDNKTMPDDPIGHEIATGGSPNLYEGE